MGGEGSQKLLLRRGIRSSPGRQQAHPVQRKLNTLPQGHPLWFFPLCGRGWSERRRWPAHFLRSPIMTHSAKSTHTKNTFGPRATKGQRPPVFLSFVTSWLRLFPRADPFLVQPDHAPARGCVLRLTAATHCHRSMALWPLVALLKWPHR
jgi:hypothetical protein